MSENKLVEPDLYVSEVSFVCGVKLPVGQNDIVVFVGPNNVGKSQCLKDIYRALGDDEEKRIVVEAIKVHLPRTKLVSQDAIQGRDDAGKAFDLKTYMEQRFCKSGHVYRGADIEVHETFVKKGLQANTYGRLREVFANFAATESRLAVCNPASNIDEGEKYTSPIHRLLNDKKLRARVSRLFRDAFGYSIALLRNSNRTTPLKCVSEDIPLEKKEGQDSEECLCEYNEKLKACPSLHEQGDGMRSFAGILLNLTVTQYKTHLVDEPEAFLHPPQAYQTGRMIAEILNRDQQIFLSTHSSDLIKGLLDVAADRVKLVRITRTDDINKVRFLDNKTFLTLWKNPLMKFSNIMDGLFHPCVVLCESDSDCKLYQAVELACSKTPLGALYIHCGGKNRFHDVIPPLKEMGVEVRAIVDFDIFNSKNDLVKLAKSAGMDTVTLENDYDVFVKGVPEESEMVKAESFLNMVHEILDDKGEYLTEMLVRKIKDACHPLTFWRKIKRGGLTAITDARQEASVRRMMAEMSAHDIYVVPDGQLESLCPEQSGHGPSWALNLLSDHPDVKHDPVYGKVREFVRTWCKDGISSIG